MLAGLWLSNIKSHRGDDGCISTACWYFRIDREMYLSERHAGVPPMKCSSGQMPFGMHRSIQLSVGVDGISVAMLLQGAVIVFTGTFLLHGR